MASNDNWHNYIEEKKKYWLYLTRPGCGLGGLNWEGDVKPILELIFDDRFVVVNNE